MYLQIFIWIYFINTLKFFIIPELNFFDLFFLFRDIYVYMYKLKKMWYDKREINQFTEPIT